MIVLSRTVGRDQGDAIKVFLDGGHLSEPLAVSGEQYNSGLWSAVTCYRFYRPRLVAAILEAELASSRRQVAADQSADKSAHSKKWLC